MIIVQTSEISLQVYLREVEHLINHLVVMNNTFTTTTMIQRFATVNEVVVDI